MQLTKEHIAYRHQIGVLNGKPVWEVSTTGGLFLVLVAKTDGTIDTLGTGPHKAIARHIAKKRERDLQITEITKTAPPPVTAFQHLLPFAEAETERFRRLA